VRIAISEAITVASGVQALMMPAKIDVTRCSAYANKIPGITFNNKETIQRISQVFRPFGSENPRAFKIIKSVNEPRAHRPKATPCGVRNSNPNFMNMKEQPHTKPRAR